MIQSELQIQEKKDLLPEEEFNFEKHEERLLKNGFLYIDYIPKNDDVESFIINELLIIAYHKITFYDENYKRSQCHKGCFRSIGDLFRITKRYFKDISLRQFCEIFWFKVKFSTHFCGDIDRRVYWWDENSYHHDLDIDDEFNWILEDFLDS